MGHSRHSHPDLRTRSRAEDRTFAPFAFELFATGPSRGQAEAGQRIGHSHRLHPDLCARSRAEEKTFAPFAFAPVTFTGRIHQSHSPVAAGPEPFHQEDRTFATPDVHQRRTRIKAVSTPDAHQRRMRIKAV